MVTCSGCKDARYTLLLHRPSTPALEAGESRPVPGLRFRSNSFGRITCPLLKMRKSIRTGRASALDVQADTNGKRSTLDAIFNQAFFDGIREGDVTKVKKYLPGPGQGTLTLEERFKQHGAMLTRDTSDDSVAPSDVTMLMFEESRQPIRCASALRSWWARLHHENLRADLRWSALRGAPALMCTSYQLS